MSELERDLFGLGETIAYPPTPDIAIKVARSLESPRRSAGAWRVWATVAAALIALAIGVTMAVPPARSSVLHFFHIGAVHVRFVDRLPVVERVTAPLGRKIAPQDSPLPLLRSSLLGEPSAVYTQRGAVTEVFGSPGDVRLLVTQIDRSGFNPGVAKKLVAGGTRADFVVVRGADGPAVWLAGQPHVVRFLGGPVRLAGNTLIWLRGGVTIRVEGNFGRDQATRIANSLYG